MNTSLHIDNHSIVTAGGILSGHVLVKVPKTLPCGALTLRLHGKEVTAVMVGTGKNVKSHKEKNIFFNSKIPIAEEHNIIAKKENMEDEEEDEAKILAGTYKVPFSYAVPSDIPPSMKLGEYDSEASIIYTLRVVFGGAGSKMDDGSGQEQVVTIQSAPRAQTDNPPAFMPADEPMFKGITKKGLSNKGRVYLNAKVTRSKFARGQKPQVKVALINDSAASLHKISLAVEQIAQWTAKQKHSSESSKTICTQNCSIPSGYAKKVNDVKRQERANDKAREKQNIQELTKAIAEENNETTEVKALSFTMPAIPKTAIDTQSTQRITVSHNLVITLMTEGAKSNPTYRIPIKIVPPILGGDDQTTKPEDATEATTNMDASAASVTSWTRNLRRKAKNAIKPEQQQQQNDPAMEASSSSIVMDASATRTRSPRRKPSKGKKAEDAMGASSNSMDASGMSTASATRTRSPRRKPSRGKKAEETNLGASTSSMDASGMSAASRGGPPRSPRRKTKNTAKSDDPAAALGASSSSINNNNNAMDASATSWTRSPTRSPRRKVSGSKSPVRTGKTSPAASPVRTPTKKKKGIVKSPSKDNNSKDDNSSKSPKKLTPKSPLKLGTIKLF